MRGNIWIYILTGFVVSYLIRVLPLTLIRRQIKNQFIRSFLYYSRGYYIKFTAKSATKATTQQAMATGKSPTP